MKIFFILGIIMVSAFAIRLIHHNNMRAYDPIYDYPIIDSKEYVNNAEFIAEGHWLGPSWPYFHPPLYTYFVALLFWLFGTSINLVRIIQILLDCINVILLYMVARKLFNTKVALLSSLIYAFYIPIIVFSVELLPPVLSISLLLVSLISLMQCTDINTILRRHMVWFGIAGLCFGLLIITLPNFLVCVPLIAVMLFFSFKATRPLKRVLYILIFVVIAMTPALLTSVRNYVYTGEKVFISYNGGVNFYIGNNENMYHTVSIPPGVEWEKFTMFPYEQERIESFSQASRFWLNEGLRYIRHNPFQWIWLMIKKGILFFNAHEFPRNFDLAFFNQYSNVSKLPAFKLNILLALGLCGVILIIRKWSAFTKKRNIVLCAVIIVGYTASIILFFIASRYRLPIIPLFIIPSAYTALYLFESRKRISIIGTGILILIIFGIVSLKPFKQNHPYTIPRTKTYALIGATFLDKEKYEDAIKYLRIGLQEPRDQYTFDLHHQLALCYSALGNSDSAIYHFKLSLQYKHDNFAACNDLASEYLTTAMPDSALKYYQRAMELAPCCAKVYLNLVEVLFAMEEYDRIIPVLESYFQNCPSPHPIISYTLGKFYMQIHHDWIHAIDHIETAIRYPHGFEITADVYNNLGICYFYDHQLDEAQRAWEQGLKLEPDNESLRNNMKKLMTLE